MSQQDIVLYRAADGVAVITLNRPEILNAYSAPMGVALEQMIGRARDDTTVRVIVLTGAGRGFCAGADMKALQTIQQTKVYGQPGAAAEPAPQPVAAVSTPAPAATPGPDVSAHYVGRFGFFMSTPKPIIAAINGPVAGIGLVFALFADLRFAAAEARFTTSFAQRGLIAEHGISWLLPRLIGPARALDLLLSARKFDAAEAAQLGLVNRVFAQATFMDDVMSYARTLATTVSPRSMAVMKAQIWKTLFQDFNESLAVADVEMRKSFETADFKEGVAHFVEKRPAAFTGR